MFYFISFLKGLTKIIDECLSDSKASFHGTVVQDKIRFHDNNDPDPDWMVKQQKHEKHLHFTLTIP